MHTNVKHIFKSKNLNQSFDELGYITLPLLNSDEVSSLLTLYNHLYNEYITKGKKVDAEYELSFFTLDTATKQNIFNDIWKFFEEKINDILPNYEPLIINMFNKKPGEGEVPIHQNWTFVDEDKYTSVSIWVPLIDVSHYNGTLEVVAGTHKNISKFRSPSIPWIFKGYEDVLKTEYMTPLNLKIGDIAIIDDSVIHYSSTNKSAKDRPSIQLILKPKKAKSIHYLGNCTGQGKVKVHEVNKDFFFDFDMNATVIDSPVLDEKLLDINVFTLDKLTKPSND